MFIFLYFHEYLQKLLHYPELHPKIFFWKIADFTPQKNLYFDIEIIVVVMVFDITMTTKVSSTKLLSAIGY